MNVHHWPPDVIRRQVVGDFVMAVEETAVFQQQVQDMIDGGGSNG